MLAAAVLAARAASHSSMEDRQSRRKTRERINLERFATWTGAASKAVPVSLWKRRPKRHGHPYDSRLVRTAATAPARIPAATAAAGIVHRCVCTHR